MKRFVVCGTGDFSDIVSDLIQRILGNMVVAYALDQEYYTPGLRYDDKDVILLDDIERFFPPDSCDAAIGLIGNDRFECRERIFKRLKSSGYKMENLIHSSSVISSQNIGCGNIILENCVIGYNARLGNGNIMWPLSAVNHHSTVGSFNNISPGVSSSGGVIIGSHCFLGNNSTYKNKVHVADYTLVGAGAYISQNTEPESVYVPERSIRLDKSSAGFY